MSTSVAYGVYMPLASSDLMLILPLYLKPSLNMEKKHGQFRLIGIIESKYHEIRSWGESEPLAKGVPVELLVTDQEAMHSIGRKMDSNANANDVLLGIVSVQ